MPNALTSSIFCLILTSGELTGRPQAGPEALDGLSLAPGSAELLAESPFTKATFNYSTQPDKMLVFVSSVSTYGSAPSPLAPLPRGERGTGRMLRLPLYRKKRRQLSPDEPGASHFGRLRRERQTLRIGS